MPFKKTKPVSTEQKAKPAKRQNLFSPVLNDFSSGLKRKRRISDWHPAKGPFPTD